MPSYHNIKFMIPVLFLLSMSIGISQAQTTANVNAQTSAKTSPAPDPPAPQKSSAAEDDSWHFTAPLFVWTPGLHGTVGAFGHNASVHVSGTDALSDLQFSLMGAFEARKGRFVLPIDFAWLNLASTAGLPLNDFGQDSARVKVNETFITPRFGYRLINTDRWAIDALAGIRYWHLGQTVTLRPSQVSRSASGNWVDGVGGASINLALSDRVGIRVFGDAGAGGANLDYQAAAWMHFKITRNIGAMGGWRYLDVDYQGNHQFVYDVAESGPLAGLIFEFGGKPPVPPSASCTGIPAELLPDEGPVAVTAHPTDFNPKHSLNYGWQSTGGNVTSDGSSAKVDVAGLAPGTYTATANITDPKLKKNNSASCSSSFTVKQPRPPLVSCNASPTTVQAGTPVTLNAEGSSPDLRAIKGRTFSASSGSVKEGETRAGAQTGQWTSTATLDTTGAQPGPLNVTLNVTDVRGLAASCDASVTIQAPPPPPVTVVSETLLSECQFTNDHKRARIDNECKAILDEVALRLQNQPDGKLVVVGYAEEEELVDIQDVHSYRAYNAKKYLTSGEGQQHIDASRIEVRKSNVHEGRKAKFYFIPAGGTFTVTDTVVVDESQMPSDTMGIPQAHKTKAKGGE
jgi:hypothetical protein